jgi:deazaflavin-dependent oxidoreductase (nitroreductase family)
LADAKFLEVLNTAVEIDLSVKGRKTGRSTSRPVWFVLEKGALYLLPVTGSDTEWYKNTLANPDIELYVKGRKLAAHAKPIRDSEKVAEVVNRFRSKHGPSEVTKYYTKLDVAVEVPI